VIEWILARLSLLPAIPRARNDATPRTVAVCVRTIVLDARDTPFKVFDRFLNPYAEDKAANKGGQHPTPTAFPVLEVPAGLIRETESCRDALRSQ